MIEQYAPQGVEFYALQKPGSHGQLPENLRHLKVLDALPGADQISPARPWAFGTHRQAGVFRPLQRRPDVQRQQQFYRANSQGPRAGREVNATFTPSR